MYLFNQEEQGRKRKLQKEEKYKEEASRKKRQLEEDFIKQLPAKLRSLHTFFNDELSNVYCLFLQAVIPTFESPNQFLQDEKPLIHELHHVLLDQLKKVMVRFVKPSVIVAADSLMDVDHRNKENQLSDSNLVVGSKTRNYIKEHPSLSGLDDFYLRVRSFFETSVAYMIKNFRLKDSVLVNATVVDVTKRESVEFSQLEFFLDRYPVLLQVAGGDLDVVQEQFLLYQVEQDILCKDRADDTWHTIGTLKDGNGLLKFSALSSVMMGILTMFHSNASCERLFSLVTKNKTKFRPTMGVQTLHSLTTHKQKMLVSGKACHQSTPPEALIRKAKKATAEKLKAMSSLHV